MSNDLGQLIDEAIKLELNVAEVYLGFHHRFPEDAGFWWELVIEEKSHAALLKNGKQYFLGSGLFPKELVGASMDAFIDTNHKLNSILAREKQAPAARGAAFKIAIELEGLAGEIHFQLAMQRKENLSEPLMLFQNLNEDNKDHIDRIYNYMRQKGIEH